MMKSYIKGSPIYVLFPFLFLEALFSDSQLKFLIRFFLYSFLLYIPLYKKSFLKNIDSKAILFVINFLIFYGIFLIIRSLFYDENKAIFGNTITTLFGNTQVGALIFLLPYFLFFSYRKEILHELKNIIVIILIVSIPVSIYYMSTKLESANFFIVLFQCLSFVYLYFPYIKKKSLIIIATILMLILLQIIEERAMFLFICWGPLSYLLVRFIKSKNLLRLYALSIITLSILITIFGLYYKISVFEAIQIYFGSSNQNAVDSRTFLYFELSEDLNSTHSWMWGKGILGSYYSETMEIAASNGWYSDNKNRIGIETGFLQYILKGGVLYLLFYMAILIIAIFKTLKHSQNDFMKIGAILLVGRFFISTISEYPCFDLKNVMIWILIGLCLSNQVLKLSNKEIYNLIHLKKVKFIKRNLS